MKLIKYTFVFILLLIAFDSSINAQELPKAVAQMSREELLDLSYDNLLALPFEDLMVVADKMEMSADELLDFFLNKDVTSASKRAEKSLNSPLSSTVLSRDEITKSGATSIPEALRLVPGMIVREKTTGNYDVHIRGNDNLPPKGMFVYSENSISLVMIDSRPVYNYAFGGTFWETLPIDLNDIERIEVIRGPASALYGPNAVSGAINIITRKVESKKPHADAQVQIGSNNSKIVSAGVSIGAFDKLKVRVSGNYTRFDRTEDDYYVFDYNNKYPASVMDTFRLENGKGKYVEEFYAKGFKDKLLANEKFGGNAFLNYEVNKNLGFDLSLGGQKSQVVSSTLGNNSIPLVGRNSESQYIDFRAHASGFQAQVNYNLANQDYQLYYPGFHETAKIFNGSLEYERTLGTLVLRPGVSYQSSIYDDSKYVDVAAKGGYLNGARTLSSVAYYLRADYKMMDKLRLIGAVRGDTYNKPDVTAFTYQFVATYDITPNNVVRAGYSRANRGPFMNDTYADYYWQINPITIMHYEGDQKMKLPTMDMYEVGYRSKITKNIMFEVEAFHSVLKDLDFFTPDQMTIKFDFTPILSAQNPTPIQIDSHGKYYNTKLESQQNGITANVMVVVNPKLNFKVFGTYQESKLTNYYPRTIWQDFAYLQDANYYGALLYADAPSKVQEYMTTGAMTPKSYTRDYTTFGDSSTVSMTNKSTPSFYGGFTVDYTPTKTWNINLNSYFYTDQLFLHNKMDELGKDNPTSTFDSKSMYNIGGKMIINLKVSYKFYKEHSVFVNTRNLFDNQHREFGYMDKVNAKYLIGLNLNF